MSFVSELRRRQVFRTAAWYGGLAWLAVEIANTVFPQFGLPDWSVRAVIVAAVLGLPVAVILAWSFDLTATGPRREDRATAAAGTATRPAAAAPFWRIPSLWISLALGAGLAISVQQAWQRLVRTDLDERPALAVLPFANLSPDPANAYFADGLHEEILATFARTRGLRVISRTSVQEYRDPQRNLKEIAEALGVTLILEGSVRRDGDDLRLTLQLIDGRTDERLWAETYDRKFKDALTLQRTVAEQVVAAIGGTLSPAERAVVEQAAPSNPEAWDRYVHALALYRANWNTEDESDLIEALLTEAIALDPRFALAYAIRASARIWRIASEPGTPEQQAAASADVERALALQPGLPDALVARGLYQTYIALDPVRAIEDLQRAMDVAPNDVNAQFAAALTLRRLGRFEEAITHFERAAALSPTQWQLHVEHALMYARIGRHAEADRAFEAMIDRFPALNPPRLLRYFNRFLATGSTDGWREEFERLSRPATGSSPRGGFNHYMLVTATEDIAGQIELFEQIHAGQVEDLGVGGESMALRLALAHLITGHPDRARPYLLEVASADASEPDSAIGLMDRAMALELLGQSEAAVRAADAAVEARPISRDAVNGAQVAMARAWVLIHSGIRAEEGYAELEQLVGTIDQQPRWVAATLPWMLLRDDQRAQQIIRSRFPGAA
jgi:TolB-like protein